MPTTAEALKTAVQLHQAGRLADAERIYCQILASDPNQADAWHLLGLIAYQRGEHELAVKPISRAIELNGMEAAYHSNLGSVFLAQGKLDSAVDCFRRTLELKPDYAATHFNLGTVYEAQGKLDEAAQAYRRAVDLNPGYAEAYNRLGNALFGQKNPGEAIDCYRRAIALRPDDAATHYNLGVAFQAQGMLDDAIASYRQALELRPEDSATYLNLGTAFFDAGRPDEAAAAYGRALELKPEYAEAHYSLGNALRARERLDEAISSYHRAIEVKPDYAEAYNSLGGALQNLGKLDEALASYRRALELSPDHSAAQSNYLYTLLFCPNLNAAAIYDEHCRWARQWAEPLGNAVAVYDNDANPTRRLRIGYVSPDYRAHVQLLFTLPVFTAHDREQVEVVCYSDVDRPDGRTMQVRNSVDQWRDIAGLSDEHVANLVRQDRIDILVDLTMHMDRGHLLVFARKPAPVQVSWLAYPGTTGLHSIGYRLTDPYLDPPGLFDRYYSEQSIRLPDCFWCYDPMSEAPAVTSLPALQRGYVTFGCLNNFCKVNAGVLKLWGLVLAAVPRSRLLLLVPEGSARQDVLLILDSAGVSPNRVDFVARQHRSSYLELYNQIDIGLDTFPYNGHTTSLDAFWMQVPVVTLVGHTVVGRAGLCQLQNLGLAELVAHSPEQFVEIAASLASDLPRLSRIRAGLRERLRASPLMDAKRFTRHIEAAYRGMWQQWCAAQGRST